MAERRPRARPSPACLALALAGAAAAGAAVGALRRRGRGGASAAEAAAEGSAASGAYDYDLFTIGGGSAGVRASRWSAAQFGARVGLAELPFATVSDKHSAGGLGGTCVIRGCVPKKLLIYGSTLPESLRDAAAYGWRSARWLPTHDWGRLIAAKDSEVSRLSGVYRKLLDSAPVDVHQGYARVVGPHEVDVDGRRFTARYICIATGSRAVVPLVDGANLPGVLTSDEALALPQRPRSLVIVGGGYIAMEFAGLFHGYGTEVHLVFRSDLPLRGFDEDVRVHLCELLRARGVHMHAGERPAGIERSWRGKLRFLTDRGTALDVDNVMFAVGRRPNSADLGLERAGVQVDSESGRVIVDEYSKTSVDSIYAIGDVTDRISLTPVALMEGVALSRTLFGGQPSTPDHDGVPYAVFSQPPVAACGLTEEQAAERYGSVDVYLTKFSPLRHSMPTGRKAEEQVMMKVLVVSAGSGPADRVVGVHMVGEGAAEVVQGLAIAMKAGATKAAFDATVGIHPTLAEEWCTMREKARTTTARGAARARL